MLETLFTSKTRVRILELFMFNPENIYYVRQISSLTGKAVIGVQREVEKLERLGILDKFHDGNRVYYRVLKSCPIFEELKSIFLKTSGIAEVLKNQLAGSKAIQFAFIYGSYAKGEENISSDIDLMVIGSISSKKLSQLLAAHRSKLQREINYSSISPGEFKKKFAARNHFISSVIKEKKIFIIGREDEFKRFIKTGQTDQTYSSCKK